MSSDNLPVAVLYTTAGSVWASAPRLLLIEKNYAPNEYTIKEVDLSGDNFSPAYLRINRFGTVPSLVIPVQGTTAQDTATQFRSLNGTTEICDFLDKSRSAHSTGVDALPAPALAAATIDTKQQQDALIQLVHSETADPNAALLLSASEGERAQKASGFVKTFLENRQKALEKYSKSEDADTNPTLAKFYARKIQENGALVQFYSGTAEEKTKEALFNLAQKNWSGIGKALDSLEAQLGNSPGGYSLGEALSLADIHLAVWLARVAFASGAKEYNDPNAAMDKLAARTKTVGPLTRAYFGLWTSRASFKQVYPDGLH